MEYRWLTNEEIEQFVNPVCVQRGWAELNINEAQPTCRLRGAFDGPKLVSFLAIQLYPVIGPAYSDPDYRDGEISRQLADDVNEFMVEARARGALTICESPVTERLAKRHGMVPVEYPVLHWVGGK